MSFVKDWQLPRLGEAIESARVIAWHVQPGQAVQSGEILLEIDTDKTVLEVPADLDGTLKERLVEADDIVESDTVIARIEVEGEPPAEQETVAEAASAQAGAERAAAAGASSEPARVAGTTDSGAVPVPEVAFAPSSRRERVFITPIARRLAAERGLDAELIRGTGPRGRVTKADVERAPLRRPAAAPPAAVAAAGDVEVAEQRIETAHGELYVRRWQPAASATEVTMVLIHGLFADVDAWESTARSGARVGARVVAMDLPCHGRSRAAVTRFQDVVEAVGEVIVQAGAGRVALVAHSFGAAVAAKVARKPDIDAASLTLFAPAGLGTEIEQSFINGMLHAGSIPALEREMRKLTEAGNIPSGAYLKTLRERLEAQAEALTLMARETSWSGAQQLDISADLAALECPIRIVHGRSDAIIPWQHALNAPPRAALHLPPRVGHMPQWEATALTGEVLVRALRG